MAITHRVETPTTDPAAAPEPPRERASVSRRGLLGAAGAGLAGVAAGAAGGFALGQQEATPEAAVYWPCRRR